MYILSTTFVVEPSVHGEWYKFFTEKFLPSLNNRHTVFCRVLSEQSDGHYTYSLQVDLSDIEDYQTFSAQTIGECVDFCAQIYGQSVLHFSTLMKKIER